VADEHTAITQIKVKLCKILQNYKSMLG